MKPSEFEISRSVESYNKKKAEDCYDTEKRLVSKLSKISIPNLIAQIQNIKDRHDRVGSLF